MTPAKASEFLQDVGALIENPRLKSTLEDIADMTRAEQKAMMEGEVSPDGSPMQPLSPVTVAMKGHSKILLLTGELRASVAEKSHSDHVEDVTETTLKQGTSDEKAKAHQFGVPPKLPARPHIGFSDKMIDASVEMISAGIYKQIESLI